MEDNYEYKLNKARQEYNEKHRNCKNCIFMVHVARFEYIGVSYNKCKVKNKIIKHPKLKAFLCQYYKVE